VARIELGESVAVLGLGLVGQIAVTLARLAGGFPVIGIDLDGFRRRKAETGGADLCVDPNEVEDLPAVIREHCPDDGANVVMEATGIPGVYPTAVKLACTAGRMVSLGSPRGTVEMSFLEDVHLREVSLLGAIQPKTPESDHIYYHWTKDRERRFVLQLMSGGRLQVERLITHVADPESCQEIYTMLADDPREALGVVFAWQ
jgi:threonine dehydrogenase-like Zn-dependent dehydrogenase